MEVRREAYLDFMTFKTAGPPMFTEIFGPLVGLKDEWRAQGASEAELDLSAFRFRRSMAYRVRVNTGWMGGSKPRILEEDDEFILGIDRYGRRVRLSKKAATIPLPMDYPVQTMDDWLEIKHHYAFSEDRFSSGWNEDSLRARDEGYVLAVGIPGGFDEPRQLMGEEVLCEGYYAQPDVIHDMLKTIGDTAEQMLDRVSSEVQVDQLSVHEDMAGNNGSLAGPKQVREFIGPYYRRAWDLLESRGARLFGQDSDGDMNSVIPNFLDAGLNYMYPNEPAAGMDIVDVRARYGNRLALMGGIDKHVIRRSREEIEAELEYKIPPMVRTGGCVLGLDHRIPNGTPLENYRFYIQKAWEIIDREAEAIQ
jgi:hypothetical protein